MKKLFLHLLIILCAYAGQSQQNNLIGSTGAVGIGTTSPVAGSNMHIYRSLSGQYNPLLMIQDGLSGGFTQLGIKGTGRTYHFGVGNTGAAFGLSDRFFIWDQNAALPRFVIDANGTVGIGTTNLNSAYKLFVEGGVRARKVKVDQATWPDYVFSDNYYLRSLETLEEFINRNKHLPDVPSAREVEKNGVDLGDNQAALLRKIEELTLYVIELSKQVKSQQQQINILSSN